MTGGPLIGGIDAGTSRIRAIVFEPDGRVVATDERPTPVTVLGEGSAEHDMDSIVSAAMEALNGALAQLDNRRRVVSLAVASFGEAGTLVDGKGRPLCEVIAWYDTRTAGELTELNEWIDARSLHAVTGLCPDPTFTLLKLLWLKKHRAEAFGAAHCWLHIADYLAFYLSGVMGTDTSLASRTMALDLANGCWSNEILDAAGIRRSILAELLPMGMKLATVRPELASRLGLDPACVVATGGHDHVAAAVAIAANRPGTLMDSMGTAEALSLAHTAPMLRPEVGQVGLNQGLIEVGGERSYYLFGGLPTSAGAIEWFRRSMTGGEDHAQLIAAARDVQPGSQGVGFFPHLRLGSPPYPDPVARGAFYGLGADIGRAVLYRAVLEGVALDTAHILHSMLRFYPRDSVGRIIAVGGSTRNDLLMEIKAALYNRPIEIAVMPEAVSLGAAMLGGMAAGVYASLGEAQAACRPLSRRVEPDPSLLWAPREKLMMRYAHGYLLKRELCNSQTM
ncbi:MAG: carbohydrate kinase [Geminicoccaceae bacterium]|nr:hypothetical protein [Geminicoccaceae bacterium]MCB9942567.1 carbohydrate kinase [Geminicoccaceae bacterium]